MQVFNMLNVHNRPKRYETTQQPSQTVPDQTMSMREILKRFTRGQKIDVGYNLPYMEESDIETSSGMNIHKLDLSEQMELLKQSKDDIDRIKNVPFTMQDKIQTANTAPEQSLEQTSQSV